MLYLHNSRKSRLQAWQMFFFYLNALLDLFFWGQWVFVFLCQPVFKKRPFFNWCSGASENGNRFWKQYVTYVLCHVQVRVPLPLLQLPVQSCQCELMGISFREVGPWNFWWSFQVKLFLRNQVNFFMLRPGVTTKNVNESFVGLLQKHSF